MTTMFLDIETLPQLASEYRSHVGEGWRDEMPPQEACDPETYPDRPEPKKVPSTDSRDTRGPPDAFRQHHVDPCPWTGVACRNGCGRATCKIMEALP